MLPRRDRASVANLATVQGLGLKQNVTTTLRACQNTILLCPRIQFSLRNTRFAPFFQPLPNKFNKLSSFSRNRSPVHYDTLPFYCMSDFIQIHKHPYARALSMTITDLEGSLGRIPLSHSSQDSPAIYIPMKIEEEEKEENTAATLPHYGSLPISFHHL